MIDESNAGEHLKEPSGTLCFSKQERLYEHVRKHVFNADERWEDLEGFDVDEIRRFRREEVADSDEDFKELAMKYQRLISNVVVRCCEAQQHHRHFLEIIPQIPEESLEKEPTNRGRDLQQTVICWGFWENLLIIASSFVINDHFSHYIIRTGYRTYPKLKKKSWLRKELSRKAEVEGFYKGKKKILIADHMG
ncbi:MAG: hypothetical protein Q4D38_13540 [Planctomycetia bacterium]|nr:hypothetical protein [Planctomycetia bacterium]